MSGTPPPDLRFRILNWIGICDQLASTRGNRVLRGLGLPMPQFVLLNHFSHRPDERKTITGIARAMQQPQPGISKTVAKLVAKGYLAEKADATDGRAKSLQLTPKGKAAHGKAVAALMPAVMPVFADWSDAELMAFWQQLDRLKVYLDANR